MRYERIIINVLFRRILGRREDKNRSGRTFFSQVLLRARLCSETLATATATTWSEVADVAAVRSRCTLTVYTAISGARGRSYPFIEIAERPRLVAG